MYLSLNAHTQTQITNRHCTKPFEHTYIKRSTKEREKENLFELASKKVNFLYST